jgi:hypothetical protein
MSENFTYTRRFAAHMKDIVVTVPDQVADDQCGFAERDVMFPALLPTGGRVMAYVDAEATGLSTPGTGDLVVVAASGCCASGLVGLSGDPLRRAAQIALACVDSLLARDALDEIDEVGATAAYDALTEALGGEG